ncbi:universal stress protein [Streptomyces lydicus]|uniref:universal stress protein n=1 Tax=Streptomyces lydicus TaxID=47763 RepID=UPI0037971BD5
MTGPVTVGADGSPAALAAADWGAHEARLREVPLRLVHAWEWQPCSHEPPAGPGAARRWSETVLQETTVQLRRRYPGLDITADFLTGPPPEVLCEAGREAACLVLGSTGVGGLAGFLLGSVAMATVAHVEGPVVLVRAPRPDEDGRPGQEPATTPSLRVVVGLDLSHPCDEVAHFAFDAAALRATTLLVVHGWSPPAYYGAFGVAPEPDWPGIEAAESESLRETLLPWREKYPGVDVIGQAVVGQPAHHLLDAAADASLVVIGRRNRPSRAVAPRIGHLAHAVLHHSPVPVAVVPHD